MLGRRPEVRERAATPRRRAPALGGLPDPGFPQDPDRGASAPAGDAVRPSRRPGRLPTDWVADQVARLDRTDGDIDALVARLAHIRTWTYIAHRADWLRDAAHWQERTRAVEDGLTDALHERLTQRFVDRRTQMLLKGLQNGEQLAAVEDDGAILVDGQVVGRLDGLCYRLERGAADAERRALSSAARRVLAPELKRRTKALIGAPDAAFALAERGLITWRRDESLGDAPGRPPAARADGAGAAARAAGRG